MAIYYVRPANGSNANAGTSFALAWQTTQYALDNIAAGDEVRLCAEATETPSVTIDLDQSALTGSLAEFAQLVAADSVDGTPLTSGHYTISGSGIVAASILKVGVTGWKGNFQRVRLTNATTYAYEIPSTFAPYGTTFRRCRFDNASQYGAYSANSGNSTKCIFIGCEFDHNSAGGSGVSSVARGFGQWIGCSFHDNGGSGMRDGGYQCLVLNCISYRNGGAGFDTSSLYTLAVYGNTAFGNTGDGFYHRTGAYATTFTNNVSKGNGGYGYNTNGGQVSEFEGSYNCSYGNTSGHIDVNGGVLPGLGNITTEPTFVSETIGNEDLEPAVGSVLIGAGFPGELAAGGTNHMDMGALQAAMAGAPSGGGAGRLINGGLIG